jgi:hypothetical protein
VRNTQYDYFISFLYRLESMSDDENGFSFAEFVHGFGDFFFCEGVQSGSRFIKDDDIGIFSKNPGDCKSLLLSS